MEYMQQTLNKMPGTSRGGCHLKFVNFEAHENHISHETQGLSQRHLVVRRGKPFKVTLLFGGYAWNPHTEALSLQVWLGDMSEWMPLKLSANHPSPHTWSARVTPGDVHLQSITVHICSPVLSSVGLYRLLLHIETFQGRRTYALGSFVLLFNPWLEGDPVYMPLDVQREEYIKSDYGLVYMGSHQNISRRPWLYGQYEPGVLEACLQLLQVSPQHLSDKRKDYILRADPVYLSRVICAMVNCNDDLGILLGRWQDSYEDGVSPTEWGGSADILRRWASSNCSPVRYGQCWVFASVLCTVMRVLGIPSRVVTVFNAAHDSDGNLSIEEYYSSTGEKLNLTKDSVWNFHVWVECWMRRSDLTEEFDGWQVVDPTPQEKSAGVFRCGPCPVAAIQRHCLRVPHDTAFIYASVDADIIRLIVHNGRVVGRTVDTECVGQLIYTKRINSDAPENLTQAYKGKRRYRPVSNVRSSAWDDAGQGTELNAARMCLNSSPAIPPMHAAAPMAPSLEVSLDLDKVPSLGDSITMCVTLTNQSGGPRILQEHVDAQLKEYNSNPQQSFWRAHKEVHVQPGQVLQLHHTIPSAQYETVLAGEDIVNIAVVVQDTRTKERFLATQEFSLGAPQITIRIEGGDSIQLRKECTAQVSFSNPFTHVLKGALLTVEGSGLLQGKREARKLLLQPGEEIGEEVSIRATSPGTKLLMATFSHSNTSRIVSRIFHKVSVTE
ncbi:protein-glutamine gamma-glutamyltransferase 5-like isoform X2 [Takifugu rubripes]|uniref:protein-glutamine gamma-glutamyltransferase 5-like isoform X2 n=1 Tax=Takifugu rubripes TaxID=31033 RepID=UPI00114569A7|nr:protein-glutamine gamma-glutamyltransferase 5-like isoform X2 [Takifugu rubripes]